MTTSLFLTARSTTKSYSLLRQQQRQHEEGHHSLVSRITAFYKWRSRRRLKEEDDKEDEDEDDDDEDDDEDDDDEEDQEEQQRQQAGRYHPEKEDMDCDTYWAQRPNQTRPTWNYDDRRTGEGQGYGNAYGREDDDESWPCRQGPPNGGGGGGNGNGNGNGGNGNGNGNGNGGNGNGNGNGNGGNGNGNGNNGNGYGQPPPQEQQPAGDEQDESSYTEPPPPDDDEIFQRIPSHAVTINVSMAIPVIYENGFPIRVTNVVKKYLNTTNVTMEFLQLEYKDGRHFFIEFVRPTIPFEEPIDGNSSQVGTSGTDSSGNGNSAPPGYDDDFFRQRRQLSFGNGNRQGRYRSWDVTGLPPGTNVSILSLIAVADPIGNLVEHMPGSPWGWYVHKIYLLAHVKPLNMTAVAAGSTATRTNSGGGGYGGGNEGEDEDEDGDLDDVEYDDWFEDIDNSQRPQPVEDMELMAWLQTELQDIVNDDIQLQGPVGPFYDTNNYYNSFNNESRQISFIEWNLQAQGIPIAGMAIPGHENWDFIETTTGDESGDDFVFPLEPVAPSSTVVEAPSSDEPSTSTTSADGKVYVEALSTSFTAQQWVGLACLLCTVVFSLVLTTFSNEVGKRRAQEELWGNLMILENADEDASYLNVGWRFAIADPNVNKGAPGGGGNTPVPDHAMLMEVFDKTGVGYRDGDSILLGGFEYKSTTAALDESVLGADGFQNSNQYRTGDSIQRYKAYQGDPSLTPCVG